MLDVLGELPEGDPDLVYLMKMATTLERQREGRCAEIVGRYPGAWVVLSFPRASLGGRRKGMDEQYGALGRKIAAEAGREAVHLAFPAETVHLLPPRIP